MSKESGFNWQYLIPGYGCYVVNKSEVSGKGKFYALNVVITFIVLGIISGGGENTKTTATSNNNKPAVVASTDNKPVVAEKAKWKIGDSIKTAKFEIKVASVTTKSRVGGLLLNETAPDGAIFIVVNFNYKNITKEPISSFSVPDAKIIDPNGTKYDEANGATLSYQTEINLNKKAISDINPGIIQKDATVFEVSKELWKNNGWKLIIDADEDIEIDIK